MLVLTRKPGEQITLTGGIVVTILKVKGRHVSVGIAAPADVTILRAEVKAKEANDAATRLPEV